MLLKNNDSFGEDKIMQYDYDKEDLYNSLSYIIGKQHEVIFITGNFACFGKGQFTTKQETLDTYINYIKDIAGDNITIVTSTFTHNIINSDIPYDKYTTKSMHGILANYFISRNDSIRSAHPFSSFSAIGPQAEYICNGNTKYPYGIDSPYDRLLSLNNPLTISLGMAPNLTCSIIHHVEFNMHVPYRYIKEFYHPIMLDDKIVHKNYYLPVVYKNIDEKRNLNQKFFDFFKLSNQIKESKLGKGTIYSYNTLDFYNSAIALMQKDIYSWLDEEPINKPYRN